jgi:hypothetical protein
MMKPKNFLKTILLGSTGALVTAPLTAGSEPAKQKIRLLVTFVTGFQHYDGPEVESQLETGMPLQLNREPHNRYDKNAVEVWTGDAKLGYVPRSGNKTIASLMDEGIEVQAVVLELEPSAFPYGSVKMEVFYFGPTIMHI